MEYLLAFILVPYLLRVLGPAQYGAIVFMQSIVTYLNLVISYGFNLTAPRDIAQAEKGQIASVFSTYFWAAFFLWIASSVLLAAGYMVVHHLFSITLDIPLFLAAYTSAMGIVVFPAWFFQGIQQMRYITILNLLGRLINVILLFALVRGPSDYVLAAFLQSCVPLFAGLVSLVIIHKYWPHILQRPDGSKIVKVYQDGWQIFLSTLAVNLYTSTDIVLLGMFTNNTVVGYYSGADKLIGCIKRGISAVNDAVYPYISRQFQESVKQGFIFLCKQAAVFLVGGIAGGFLLLVLSPRLVPWLLGADYIPSVEPLQILAFVPLAVGMSGIMGYETMLPLGMQSLYSKILMVAALFNLAIIIPLIKDLGVNGAAFSSLATEWFITMLMAYFLWKRRKTIKKL